MLRPSRAGPSWRRTGRRGRLRGIPGDVTERLPLLPRASRRTGPGRASPPAPICLCLFSTQTTAIIYHVIWLVVIADLCLSLSPRAIVHFSSQKRHFLWLKLQLLNCLITSASIRFSWETSPAISPPFGGDTCPGRSFGGGCGARTDARPTGAHTHTHTLARARHRSLKT